jgi:hypothetical protein
MKLIVAMILATAAWAAECHVTKQMKCWNEKYRVWMVCQLRDCDDGSSYTVPDGTMPVVISDGTVIWVVRESSDE